MKIWTSMAARHAEKTKAVVTQYHKYLKENSLIRSVSDPKILPPEPKEKSA